MSAIIITPEIELKITLKNTVQPPRLEWSINPPGSLTNQQAVEMLMSAAMQFNASSLQASLALEKENAELRRLVNKQSGGQGNA